MGIGGEDLSENHRGSWVQVFVGGSNEDCSIGFKSRRGKKLMPTIATPRSLSPVAMKPKAESPVVRRPTPKAIRIPSQAQNRIAKPVMKCRKRPQKCRLHPKPTQTKTTLRLSPITQ